MQTKAIAWAKIKTAKVGSRVLADLLRLGCLAEEKLRILEHAAGMPKLKGGNPKGQPLKKS